MDLTHVSRAQLQYGESLQEFSARVLGDASKWVAVAALNNLSAPYVSPVPGARLAVFGDTLLIPSVSADIEPAAKTAEEVLKVDVALMNGGFLQAGGGDFSVVAGRDNLRQALGVRVVTDPGELLFHLDYGCTAGRLKGGKVSPAHVLLAQSYVEKAVAEDPRVADVTGSKARQSGDAILVEVQCSSVTGHPVNTTAAI